MIQLTQAIPDIGMHVGVDRNRRIGVACLIVVYVSLWLVTGRYWGLEHDAQIYAAQALAKLNPAILSQDLFLRFQSQDDYTLFPYLYAAVIRSFGLDYGAAMLTVALTLGWYWASWNLARRLVGVQQAWLAIGLLLAFPGWYGAGHVFRTAEPFLSARPAAEVLCLVALALVSGGRNLAATLPLGVAFLMHPIMALPGALVCAAIVTHGWWSQRARRWSLGAIIGGTTIVAGAGILCGADALMTDPWLAEVRHRSSFLFPTGWPIADRQTAVVPILTILLASRYLEGRSRLVAIACLWVAVMGLTLALFTDVVLPAKLLLQGQPWRWIWPATVVAVILLPATVQAAWRRGGTDRAAAMFCCASWALLQWSSTEDVGPIGVSGALIVLACLASAMPRTYVSARVSRLLVSGAAFALAAVAFGLLLSILAVIPGRLSFGIDPLCVQVTGNVLAMPAASALAVIFAWMVTIHRFRGWGCAFVASTAAALGIAAGPGAVAAWTIAPFGAPERAKFAAFRSAVPPDAEVLWWNGLRETWFLIERRSYLSQSQLGGIVFSDALASEARRRSAILEPLVHAGFWYTQQGIAEPRKLTRDILTRTCVTDGPDFVVSEMDLGDAVAKAEWPTRGQWRYLYRCAQQPSGPHG